MTSDTPVQQSTDYDEMFEGIKAIAEGLRGLQELRVAQYTPVVEFLPKPRMKMK